MSIALMYLLAVLGILTPSHQTIDNHPEKFYREDGNAINVCAEFNGVLWCYETERYRVEA